MSILSFFLFSTLLLSPCLAIIATPKLSLVPSSTTVPQSTPLNVTWFNADPLTADDWIAFWQIGSSPKKDHNFVQFSWQYTYGGQSLAPNTLLKSPPQTGTIAVIAPSQPGTYELYFCLNNGYDCPASASINVVEAVIPKVNCPANGKTLSNIEHIILIVSENHSFDSIYGSYCQAPTNSNPQCTEGAACCEAAPATLAGRTPVTLSDEENAAFDPDHSQLGETCKQNGGKMDNYVGVACPGSSDDRNFAIADETSGHVYREMARNYAMADRCFQSAIGASSENDMYYITGQFLFVDNMVVPQNSDLIGARCYHSNFISYYNPTILDLLSQCGISWVNYAEGYGVNPSSSQCYPTFYDASDYAASYYPRLTANPEEHWKDMQDFFKDIAEGSLPAYGYIKGLGINSEHPGNNLSNGENITQYVVDAVMNSSIYGKNTLVVLVPDESGGFFDHITPPPLSAIDGQNYGPRIPLILVGDAVYKNYISHVQMEPTSIVKFIEWNWFGGETGQLRTRDQVVPNLGSLIDPNKAGVEVPIF